MSCETSKGTFWLRRVLQYTKTNDFVERLLRKRDVEYVALEKMQIRHIAIICQVGFNSDGVIEGKYIGAGFEKDLRKSSGTRSSLKNTFSFHVFGPTGNCKKAITGDGETGITVKLSPSVSAPLKTKRISIVFGYNKTGYSVLYRIMYATGTTYKFSILNSTIFLLYPVSENKVLIAGGTQILLYIGFYTSSLYIFS